MSLEDTSAPSPGADSAPAPSISPAGGSIAPPAPPAVTPDTPDGREAVLDGELNAVWDKFHPPRGEAGKFASTKEPAPEGAEAPAGAPTADAAPIPAAEPAATETPVPPTPQEPEPAKPAIEPPNAWTGEMKAKWASVPPEAQVYIAQREADVHKAITRAGEKLKGYAPLDQVLQHNQDVFERNGVDAVNGISQLLRVQRKLEADPAQALYEIGASYGFDLTPLLQAQAQARPAVDPAVNQLVQRLSQVEGHLTARQREEAASQAASLKTSLDSFSKGKPHFEAVRKSMGALMVADENLSLDDAYERAVHADPTIRTRILQDQRKAEDEKRTADAKAQAEKARKAGNINVHGDAAKPSPKSVDDALKELERKHYGNRGT